MEFYPPGNRPSHRPKNYGEKLHLENKHIMSELQTLKSKNTEAAKNFKMLEKETAFYW